MISSFTIPTLGLPSFPNELLRWVLFHLDPIDLPKLAACNRHLHYAVRSSLDYKVAKHHLCRILAFYRVKKDGLRFPRNCLIYLQRFLGDHPPLFHYNVAAIELFGLDPDIVQDLWPEISSSAGDIKSEKLQPMRIQAIRTAAKKGLWPTRDRESEVFDAELDDAVTTAGFMKSLDLLDDLRRIFPESFSADLQALPLHLFFFASAGAGFLDGVRLIPAQHPILTDHDDYGVTLLHEAITSKNIDCVRLLLDLGASVSPEPAAPATDYDWEGSEGSDISDFIPPLNLAIDSGDHSIMHLLLERGADVTSSSSSHEHPFHLAVERDDDLALQMLLDFEPHIEDNTLNTLLVFAAEGGRLNCIRTLLDAGAELDEADDTGYTPLLMACKRRQTQAARMLISRGANVVFESYEYPSLLHVAVNPASGSRDDDLIKLLVSADAPVNVTDSKGRTPLHCALQKQFTSAAMILLQGGADPNHQCHAGNTPLHVLGKKCRRDRHVEQVLEKMLRSGADPNVGDAKGCTALHLFAFGGDCKLIQMLLDAGAAVNAIDHSGRSAIRFACERKHVDAVRVLLNHGASASVSNPDTPSPARPLLHIAMDDFIDRPEFVRLLVDAKAPPNELDSKGRTPLLRAVEQDLVNEAATLLDGGANPNIACPAGRTSLHYLMLCRWSEALEQLQKRMLEVGVDVNLKDNDGSTALHLAASKGPLERVRMLLDASAEVDAVDGSGFTPLYIASMNYIWGRKGTVPVATKRERLAALIILIKRGASLSKVRSLLPELLHCAALGNECELLRLLIEAQVPVNVTCENGETPLHCALRKNHVEAAMMLLENGADPNARNTSREDSTGLHTLAEYFRGEVPLELLDKLLESGMNLNAVDSRNRTALHVAAENIRLALLLWLLRREDVDKNALDSCGKKWMDKLKVRKKAVKEWLEKHAAEIAK
ncbi:hypothetical protein HDU96_005569 [Phlyctochytrium bullatum]|nr:hypothetical protein HDU96_005569 [Phlyctochytrium bullatum]